MVALIQMLPIEASDYPTNAAHPEQRGDSALREYAVEGSNREYIGRRQFALRALITPRNAPVALGVLSILGGRGPFEIAQANVANVKVLMVDLAPFLGIGQEGYRDKARNVERSRVIVLAQRNDQVTPPLIAPMLQDGIAARAAALRNSPNSTFVRDLINAFVANDGQPRFHITYCTSRPEHHAHG